MKVDHEILCGSEKAKRIYNVMLWPRMCSDYYSDLNGWHRGKDWKQFLLFEWSVLLHSNQGCNLTIQLRGSNLHVRNTTEL